ncbi:MAG TPA: cytochrome c oxidase subunit 3 [Gaiellaceae bacterium]|jgi:heme/copper-type cytochrome/quinol oxidase subunit 3|nr:cytochrome c oxidase subunit 3 [Gaiellaceae bacterium]
MTAIAGTERARVAQPNGWWGMALFLAGETALFGVLVATYFFLRFKTAQWPPGGIEAPHVVLPLVLTGILVATSFPMLVAAVAARRGAVRVAWWAVLGALVVQSGYFGMQIHLFLADLDKFTPQENAYGSIYFTLLGAHHLHVAVGLLFNLWLALRLTTGLTPYRVTAVRVIALYWHVVNALALVVLGTILSASV